MCIRDSLLNINDVTGRWLRGHATKLLEDASHFRATRGIESEMSGGRSVKLDIKTAKSHERMTNVIVEIFNSDGNTLGLDQLIILWREGSSSKITARYE